MGRAAKPIIALLVVGLAVFLATHFLGKGGRKAPPRTETGAAALASRGLDAEQKRQLEATADLVAPQAFQEALDRYAGTPAETELRSLLDTRAAKAFTSLETRVDDLLGGFRYRSAGELIDQYRTVWARHRIRARMETLRAELEEEQAGQVESRRAEAEALLDAGRFDAARETVATSMELEEKYQTELQEFATALERRIRVAQHQSTAGIRPGPTQRTDGKKPTVAGVPSPPPALPGFPHPDVKRLGEARTQLASAKSLFAKGRYHQAAKSLAEIVGFYGDLRFVQRQSDAVGAMTALSRHKTVGLAGLFNATKVERKGKRIKLHYTFANKDEMLDWEALPTIPHREAGEFVPARNGVQGHGVMTFLLRGFFENDVIIRATSVPNSLKSHGLSICQAGLETRQLMWLCTNHFFVEGENYVKARPGHSILMFGKGVNNDVPVDSPEIGFIFRGNSITKPEPTKGNPFQMQFRVKGDEMSGGLVYKGDNGALSGSCKGDDGRGISRLRPGLFVLENSVVFRDIVIEGRIHADFEKERVNELLEIASTLD